MQLSRTTELAEVIRQRGSRQTYLAEAAGVSPSHLNRALKLERPLSAAAVAKIASLLGVSLDDVYDGRALRERKDHNEDASTAAQRQRKPSRKVA